MNYDLAKRLQVAGFPLQRPGNERQYFEIVDTPEGDPLIFVYPTLSELIQACVGAFPPVAEERFTLSFSQDGWSAFIPNIFTKHDLLEGFFGVGPTPEDAVATLWLALNKK
jgi:hypothetical protein